MTLWPWSGLTRRYATWLSLMCFLLNPVGYKGDKMRLFLTDEGYQKALENQERGFIKLKEPCQGTQWLFELRP